MSDLSLAFSFVNMHEINNPDNNMPKAYKELINSYYMLNFRFRAINTDDADDSSPNAVKIKKILSDNDRAIQVNDTPLMKQNDKIKVAIATKKHNYSCSKSASHSVRQASLGIRQSPLGERVTLPTFGASGRQERLNC